MCNKDILSEYAIINHKLAIETGRYSGIDRNLRYCDMCNLEVLGDEYHFFFECVKPDIVTLRQQCIPRYYLQVQHV